MSGEPQLERSVLEGKERDKLQAIAEALGLKPTARAKKADLIDGILRATGVEAAPAEAEAMKPKRPTRKRAAEVVAAPPGDDQGVVATMSTVENAGDPPAESAPQSKAEPEPEIGADVQLEPAPAEPPAAAANGEAKAQEQDQKQDGGRNGRPGPAPQPQPQPQPPRAFSPPGPPGPGNHAVPPAGSQAQPAPGSAASQSQPGQPGQQGQGAPAEGGDVRRNRRRRGRDRDRVGVGYDQQAQQADQAYSGEPIPCDGLLELRPDGFGFLRTSGYVTGPDDVYVSTSQIRKFALRAGDRIVGASRPATTQERFGALLRIDAVGDQSPEEARRRPRFEDLTPVFPSERLTLELGDPADPAHQTGRVIDLLAPLGKGQRGLVVAPPRAGKTTVVKHIARAVEANHPDVDLMVLLVDERPEEVTDLRRSVKGDVIGSTADRPPEEQANVADLVIEVAKRRVELGRDVVVIVDGISRLARAYGLAQPPTGRILPGGVDAGAVSPSKRFFGAGRNLEEGGSLTIVATALVETGSALDAVIFEELRGSASSELRLDGRLAERRTYPAVDITASSTGQDELLLGDDERQRVRQLRRELAPLGRDGRVSSSSGATEASEQLLDRLKATKTNADFLADLARTSA